MLDLGLGGFGVADGMRKEQDRITQNRTQFSNNIANFLASNPYLSPEAVQAYVNAAAGTDNTLRGVIPNQLVGEFNKENSRVRRIDTFKAFNEFTRLNPGATAAEFQSAMSALGAQGIYGDDALKTIQGRADQYRKDQETKRMYEQAQNISQLRTNLMTDAKGIMLRNGFDVDKTRKELEQIYGTSTPVPLDTIVNPGMATMIQGDLVREYLPRAVEILGKNPSMTPEMLYGIFPELQNSPVVKSIYEAAQTERTKGISDKLYGSKKQVVDSVAQSIMLGADPQKALTESIRGLGIRPEDMSGLDTSTILSEAKALADKGKADEKKKLDASLAGAMGKMHESIRTNTLADPNTLQTLANGDIGAVESFVRARIRDESGLTEEELARIPDSYYSSLARSIRQRIIANASIEQKKLYDTVVGSEGKIRTGLVEKSVESAKNFTSASAIQQIKNAGLEQSVAGAAIPTIMSQLAQQYDVTGVNGTRVFNYLISAAQKEPDADMGSLLGSVPAELLVPINDMAQQQVEQIQFEMGALSDKPIRATDFVSQRSKKIYNTSQNMISTIIELSKDANMSVEERMLALQSAKQQVLAGVAKDEAYFQDALGFEKQWDYNDRFSNSHAASLSSELRTNAERVINLIDASIADLKSKNQKQRVANMAPGRILEDPVDVSRSGLYNTLSGLKPNEARQKYDVIAGELSRYELGGSPLGYIYKSVEDRELYRQIADLAYSPGAVTFLLENPNIYALIDSNSPTVDPKRFIQEFNREYNKP